VEKGPRLRYIDYVIRFLSKLGGTLVVLGGLAACFGVGIRFGYDCPAGGIPGDSDGYNMEMDLKLSLLRFALAATVVGTVLVLVRWRVDWAEPALRPYPATMVVLGVIATGTLVATSIALLTFAHCPT
jgi:hypothetical protein